MYRIRHSARKESVGYYAKKKTPRYIERDEREREKFIEELNALPEDAQIYYADESGFDEYYSRDYGYAPRNERVYGEISGTHFARTSVIAAILCNVFIAAFAYKGFMNGDLFEGWLLHVFVPCLNNPGKSYLFIDNATHHRKDAIYEIADEHGFNVIFLPKYSPDFNPIEKKWANVKNRLRLHLHKFNDFWDALKFAFQ